MSQVSFFDKNSEAQIKRRRAMAERLMKQGEQKQGTEMVSGIAVKQSPLEGLAKALQTGLGGYMEGQAAQMEAQKGENARKTMQEAMRAYSSTLGGGSTTTQGGETINWDTMPVDKAGQMYANLLMQNEDTAPMGMQALQNQMQNQQALDMYLKKFPMELELARQKAAISAQYAQPPASFQEFQLAQQYPEYARFTKAGDPTNRKLTAAEQKEIFDLQDKQAAIEGALSGLTQAESIYSRPEGGTAAQPYTGAGADIRTEMARVPLIGELISDKDRAAATTEAKNLVTEQALNNMKAIFGGNPTEGERAILLQLQALPSMTPQEQKVVIENAIQAANRRKVNYGQRLSQIETGQYFQPPVSPVNPEISGKNSGTVNPATIEDYSQIQPLLETQMNGPAPQMQGANMPPPAPVQPQKVLRYNPQTGEFE